MSILFGEKLVTKYKACGAFKNDVTQIWTIFYPPLFPVLHTYALGLMLPCDKVPYPLTLFA